MNVQAILKALLSAMHADPSTALVSASALLKLLALNPAMLATLLPDNSPSALVAYAKANPAELVAFLQAEIALLTQHPKLLAALVSAVPGQ